MAQSSRCIALAFALAAASGVGTAGCASDHADAAPYEAPAAIPSGLELDTNTTSRVAGRFTHSGATVGFDFSRAAGVKHAVITTASHAPLIDSLIEDDGSHRTRVLGERLVVAVTSGHAPVYVGDRAAESELAKMPEGQTIGALEQSLALAAVDPEVLPAGKGTSGLHIESGGSLPCGSWMSRNQYVTCGTVFFGYSSLYLVNYSAYFNVAWVNGEQHILSAYGFEDLGGWHWGASYTAVDAGYCPAPYCGSVNFWPSIAGMVFTH